MNNARITYERNSKYIDVMKLTKIMRQKTVAEKWILAHFSVRQYNNPSSLDPQVLNK